MTGNLKRSVIFTASIIACGALFPSMAQATVTITAYVKITALQVVPSTNGWQNVYLGTTTAWPNVDGCSNPNLILVPNSVTNYDLVMTMLYDAYSNGDLVSFKLNGCSTVGTQTFPTVTEFYLQKN